MITVTPIKHSTETLFSAGGKDTGKLKIQSVFISKPHNLHVINVKKPVKLLQEVNSKSIKVEAYEIDNKITSIFIFSKLENRI